MAKYNAALSAWKDQIEGMPTLMAFDDVKDPELPIYRHLKVETSERDKVPFAMKRSAIDLHNFIERCKEECQYIHVEAVRLVKHFQNMRTCYESCMSQQQEDATVHAKGLRCVVQMQILECDNKLHLLGLLLRDILPEDILSSLQLKNGNFKISKNVKVKAMKKD